MYNALRPSVWIEDHKGVSQSGLITETLKELCVNKASWNDMERHVGVVDGVAVAFPMGAICSTSTYDNLLFESVDVDLGRQCGCIGYGLCAPTEYCTEYG